MKCPKCGYNSFEYYDSCKKCSTDLTGYKQTYSIASVVLPLEAKEKIAAEFHSTENTTEEPGNNVETHDDIFSFDLPDDLQSTSAQQNDDPFNFDEPEADIKQTMRTESGDNVFATLLESTSQSIESPFAPAQSQTVSAPAEVKAAVTSLSPGEFDLESFSWDDASVTAPAASDGSPAVVDDFDSLFGNTKDNSTK
jgi:hypothetical protein